MAAAMRTDASSSVVDGSSSEEGEGGGGGADDDGEDDIRAGGGYYDDAALRRLRDEQGTSTRTRDGATTRPDPYIECRGGEEITKRGRREDIMEEDYISLLGRKNERTKTPADTDTVILTGDEAMALAEREEEKGGEDDDNIIVDFDPHGLFSPPTPPPSSGGAANVRSIVDGVADADDLDGPSRDVEEGNRRWEETMARRAGVLPPKTTTTTDGNGGRARSTRRNAPESTFLKKIRASLQPTLSNLGDVLSDLETGISRHQSTLSSANDELTRHQSNLKKHGEALEYYQGLRVDLATWMGALRELNNMVDNVEEARRLLEAHITWMRMERFLEWANDCTEVLETHGLLRGRVAGVNDDVAASGSVRATAYLDEFGRDLLSMSSIARVKRWNLRRTRRRKRLQDDMSDSEDRMSSLKISTESSNDDNFDVAEIEEWRQRSNAIQQAILIIPNLVKDDYLSISNLCSLFFGWERMYPDDYANSYAEISIIRMLEVLAKLECEKWDVLNLHGGSSPCLEITQFNWVQSLETETTRVVGGTSTKFSCPKAILLEVVKKVVLGRILDVFSFQDETKGGAKQHGIFDPFSEIQTKRLCLMVKSIFAFFLKFSEENARIFCEETAEKLLTALLSLLRYYIGKLTVPIMDASKIIFTENEFATKDSSTGLDSETSDAIAYASIVQVRELCKLVTNILRHWYPIINEQLRDQHDRITPLVQFVFLDLVSRRILPTLHSSYDIMSGGSVNDESGLPEKSIREVSDAMHSTGLLDKDEWMLMAAPLRTAAKLWKDNLART
ncbi:hypothetical protein ACHAXA_003643 [Cyclostephanos tholiformis]|uniref:Exocyst complex component Sec8 n=1 Tax=Cyclostephanos tholiformis TaxID=382380 RepID=A0ABD3SP25_9STRA